VPKEAQTLLGDMAGKLLLGHLGFEDTFDTRDITAFVAEKIRTTNNPQFTAQVLNTLPKAISEKIQKKLEEEGLETNHLLLGDAFGLI